MNLFSKYKRSIILSKFLFILFTFSYKNVRIPPTELEDILQEHPAVSEAMVFGKPDPILRELVTGVVVLEPAYQASKSLETNIVSITTNK